MMGVSKQQAVENRRAIVAAAQSLFRDRGVDGVGIAELMKAAGFTQGGFYNHFKSKDDLVTAVLAEAMQSGSDDFETAIQGARTQRADPLAQQIEWYLSADHRKDLETGCPLSGFVGDVRRLQDGARQSYAEGLATNLERLVSIVRTEDMSDEDARQKAVTVFSQMVGGLLLSRAVADADPELADEILERGKRHLHAA